MIGWWKVISQPIQKCNYTIAFKRIQQVGLFILSLVYENHLHWQKLCGTCFELKMKFLQNRFFFLKPDTAILPEQRPFYIPDFSKEIHHEIELVLKNLQRRKEYCTEFCFHYFDQITVGIDFTARDIQQKQKKKACPWEPAKTFDHSAPVEQVYFLLSLANPQSIRFHLDKNGNTVQTGSSDLMIHSLRKWSVMFRSLLRWKRWSRYFQELQKA